MAKLSKEGSRPLAKSPAYRAPRAAPAMPDGDEPEMRDSPAEERAESMHDMADRMHPTPRG